MAVHTVDDAMHKYAQMQIEREGTNMLRIVPLRNPVWWLVFPVSVRILRGRWRDHARRWGLHMVVRLVPRLLILCIARMTRLHHCVVSLTRGGWRRRRNVRLGRGDAIRCLPCLRRARSRRLHGCAVYGIRKRPLRRNHMTRMRHRHA